MIKRIIIRKRRGLFVALGIVIFIAIMRWLGFRITYNPELDDNWEAVSACGTWFCGCIVLAAVIFLQHCIKESEKKTSTSNLALLEEINLSKECIKSNRAKDGDIPENMFLHQKFIDLYV